MHPSRARPAARRARRRWRRTSSGCRRRRSTPIRRRNGPIGCAPSSQRASGRSDFEACVVVDLAHDPAWAEPTRPPRLLLPRRTLADESVARFAAARAMHALVVRRRRSSTGARGEDVAALLRAAATLFLPDLRRPSAASRSPRSCAPGRRSCRASRSPPSTLGEAERGHLEVVLAAAVVDSQAAAGAADYARAERLTADRVALAATGDLRAALVALAPADATTPDARAAALAAPPLSDLIAFALAAT